MDELEKLTGDLMGAIDREDGEQAAKCAGKLLRHGLASLRAISNTLGDINGTLLNQRR